MLQDRYRPSALTVAVTGGDVLPSQSEFIPRGVEGIATAAIESARAGASSVHLHARDDDGRPSASPAMFTEIVDAIREQTDVVINVTTGGAPGMKLQDKLVAMQACKPDICTFNLGTMNFESWPDPARWPNVQTDWEREILEGAGSATFINTLAMLRETAAAARDVDATPELEAYDLGHLYMARHLIDEGTLQGPVRVQLVLGVLGGAGSALEDLFTLHERAHRILGNDLADLGVAGLGYPMQFRHAATALGLGMDCRVGIEDSLRVRRDQPVHSNAEMVEVVVDLADLLGRPIATPAELRARLTKWSKS
ncbi:3-keto-5-aminohexanoate cleavage protein [Nocardia pseudovaccinii]|uniref:3-keto-5-aminohexanoate cleavage protein n=1 Tax=Nocardia pseudovaccinii TaxID=189540 RepID=UPI0007C8497A|nr:3-keto-5-aminohexanoate cleavage protein [Nocardia pseudovaccinii]